jgi:hypothetical protein
VTIKPTPDTIEAPRSSIVSVKLDLCAIRRCILAHTGDKFTTGYSPQVRDGRITTTTVKA